MSRSAFIAVIGSPNVGKSTLVNRIVGAKVAIVSNKPQTTRNRIAGILKQDDFQMVFLDTPGIFAPRDRLGEFMVKTAFDAFRDVDAVLFVCDALHGIGERDSELLQELVSGETPFVVAVNKADAAGNKSGQTARELKKAGAGDVHIISAKTGDGVDGLMEALKEYLAEGPQYYPDDYYTDQPERVVAAEMIREKALRALRQEVPHGIGVVVEKVAERKGRGLTDVSAVIICERDSHKAIIIGKGGNMLRRIGSEARKDLEMFFGTKVFLQLFVKVEPGWRDNKRVMHELGYE